MSLGQQPSNPDSDTLDDVDLIWGEWDDTHTREWSKMKRDFTNAGYREGITAGKDAALQEGFNDGFARVGVPLGRELGLLRGATSAALSLLSSSAYHTRWNGETSGIERCRDEVRSILSSLGQIHLADVTPPDDLQIEEHDQLGVANVDGPNLLHSVECLSVSSATTPAVEELDRLRMRLSVVLQEIGLDIPLI